MDEHGRERDEERTFEELERRVTRVESQVRALRATIVAEEPVRLPPC